MEKVVDTHCVRSEPNQIKDDVDVYKKNTSVRYRQGGRCVHHWTAAEASVFWYILQGGRNWNCINQAKTSKHDMQLKAKYILRESSQVCIGVSIA
jgi:hypothetical protein